MEIVDVAINELTEYENNPRINDESVPFVANSIKEFGFLVPCVIDADKTIIAGHTRLKAARRLGMKTVPCIYADKLTPEQVKAFRLADNKVGEKSEWDIKALADEINSIFDIDMTDFGFGVEDVESIEAEWKDIGQRGSLAQNFLAPPFSILNCAKKYWQDRKNLWKALGIKSGEGRVETWKSMGHLAQLQDSAEKKEWMSTSIFDPVLCEVMLIWFSRVGDKILDPFAGGSVRGIVTSKLGRTYTGIDLSEKQINEDIAQAEEILTENMPCYKLGDSREVLDTLPDDSFDMMLSCPPYADLEVYSHDEKDLSNMDYPDFLAAYEDIIAKTYDKLKDGAFVAWVVGECRGKDGNYYNFIGDTISAFRKAGFNYYNELILATPIGTGGIRSAIVFKKSRKICKVHQNVLVFVKGDWRKACGRLGDVEVLEITDEDEEE